MPVQVQEDRVIFTHGKSTVLIYLWGATLTSWVYDSKELIFVSKKANYNGPKAIRGGIPLVFPQFGPVGKLPQHGFARVSKWKWLGITKETADSATISFSLEPASIPADQRALWSFDFHLVYNVTLQGNTLNTQLIIKNTDQKPFDFTTLLHTYFRVQEVTKINIAGLKQFDFVDSLVQHKRSTENRDFVTINEEVDRVYENVTGTLKIANTNVGNGIEIVKTNFKDVVVWNPWIENARKMADFDDEEYKEMVCVEVGSVADKIQLSPNEEWVGGQTLVAL